MQIRLFFNNSEKNLDVAKIQLKKKYKVIDELTTEIQKRQCNAPDKLDDYMLWQALAALEREEEENKKYDSIKTRIAQIKFNEEIIYFTSDFYEILTPRRMDLLEYINGHNPKSVKTLAAELMRDYKNVYDDLLALERYHLIEFIREGKNKRPVSRLTSMDVIIGK